MTSLCMNAYAQPQEPDRWDISAWSEPYSLRDEVTELA
jgi:hypothetical protein